MWTTLLPSMRTIPFLLTESEMHQQDQADFSLPLAEPRRKLMDLQNLNRQFALTMLRTTRSAEKLHTNTALTLGPACDQTSISLKVHSGPRRSKKASCTL